MCSTARVPSPSNVRVPAGFALGAYIYVIIIGAISAILAFAATGVVGDPPPVLIILGVVSVAVIGLSIAAIVLQTKCYGQWAQKRSDPKMELPRGQFIGLCAVAGLLALLLLLNAIFRFVSAGEVGYGTLTIVFAILDIIFAAMLAWHISNVARYMSTGLPLETGAFPDEENIDHAAYQAPTQPPHTVQPQPVPVQPVQTQATPSTWTKVTGADGQPAYHNPTTQEVLPLPTGFESAIDPTTGAEYIVDHNTRTTTFDFPAAQARAAAAVAG